MKTIRIVLASIRKADETFNLISSGDKIVVGISGGKDSILLLYALKLYQKFSKCDFEIQPVMLDLGFPNFNPKPIKTYVKSLGFDLIIENSKDVYKILDIQQKRMNLDHLPCSICSRMKKAAINKVAKELGYNKVAFAHHIDDALETLFMNEIYGGKIATFSPTMHLDNANITFIRPFIFLKENDISKCIKEEQLETFSSSCPADKHTKREEVKKLLNDIYQKFPTAKKNFQTMLLNEDQTSTFDDEINYKIDGNLSLKKVTTAKENTIHLTIRQQTFVDEQGVNLYKEWDEDNVKEAFNIYLRNIPIGTIRYRINNDKTVQLEHFAIKKEYRRLGYGAIVLSFICKYIRDLYNPCTLKLNGETNLKNFYIKNGFTIKGEEFIPQGHTIPHLQFEKELK